MTDTDHDGDGQQAEPVDMNHIFRDELARIRAGTAARFRDHLEGGWDPDRQPPPGPHVHQPRPAPRETIPAARLFPPDPEPPTAA